MAQNMHNFPFEIITTQSKIRGTEFVETISIIVTGVSISSEVGGRPIKVGGGNTSGAARPLPLGWSGGILPQKILESRSPEMPFPVFWHQIQY